MAALLEQYLSQALMSYDAPHRQVPPQPAVADGFEPPAFEISDYLLFDEVMAEVGEEYYSPLDLVVEQPPTLSGGEGGAGAVECDSEAKRMRMDPGRRVGFRTQSVVEVLDDGYKWRKYGKKSVKNSPNPRNYYKCSTEGCRVKKRVERDREDPSYVITTYEGKHNHACPAHLYGYNSPSSSSFSSCTTAVDAYN